MSNYSLQNLLQKVCQPTVDKILKSVRMSIEDGFKGKSIEFLGWCSVCQTMNGFDEVERNYCVNALNELGYTVVEPDWNSARLKWQTMKVSWK